MVGTSTRFARKKAPYGKTLEGRRHREDDDEDFLVDDLYYDCGCRRAWHIYHDGTVLMDDHSAEHAN